MATFDPLNVEPVINACGPVTRLGGAPMPPEVIEAIGRAAGDAASLAQLQAAASRVIARHTGAEAGLVTSGSAAALTLGAAAILAGLDPARMERLPDTSGFPAEFVVAREQRSGYDHAVRAAGGKLVEAGFNEIVAGAGVRRTEAWELEAAISDRTAGILYVVTPDSRPPLEEVVELARRHLLPVLVDAAGQLPPRENLRRFIDAGADLVCFSGGKAIRGPQASGILCGRAALVASAAVQMLDMDDHPELWSPPLEWRELAQLRSIPRHGIGRAMKVAKEEIVGLVTALNLFAAGKYDEELPLMRSRLELIAERLAGLPVECQIVDTHAEVPPLLRVTLGAAAPRTAMEVCRLLREGSPPIHVGHGELHDGRLVLHPLCLREGHAELIAQRLATVLQ
ncbi:MAG: selenocysteine synthase [Planctomycetales bacterium]|nr:selenocysteine synthase [Planctomycetales bacterium]